MKICRVIILSMILLPQLLNGQSVLEPNSFKKDFNDVANIFENTKQDYLYSFAEIRFSHSDSLKKQEAINSLVDKTKKLRSESFNELSLEPEGVNHDFLLGYFSMMFTTEFPWLDKKYFGSCKEQVKALKQ